MEEEGKRQLVSGAFSSQTMYPVTTSAQGRKPFSLPHKKGTVDQAGLQQGGRDCAECAGTVGKGKDPQGQHSRRKNEETRRQEGWDSPWECLGDVRLLPAINDSDRVSGLHPQSTWLCDLPHTTSLRKPNLWRQKKGSLGFWSKS